MAEDQDSKTEDPTEKRKTESRNKGQVAKSQDLNTGFMLLLGVGILWVFGERTYHLLEQNIEAVWSQISTFELSQNNLIVLLEANVKAMLYILWPIGLFMLIGGLLINLVQVGFLWSNHKLKPDFSKPFKLIEGAKRLFGPQAYVNLLKGLLKMVAVGFVVYMVLTGYYETFLFLLDQPFTATRETIFNVGLEMSLYIALLYLVIGIGDFVYQKFKHNKQMKMSKHEVKDERKQSEGDPKIKAELRKAAMKILQQSAMDKVPQATVVVTNPTFLALAIQYNRGEQNAPILVAKGKRIIAEKIRDIAMENEIPLVENKPLARAMIDSVEIGDEIPAEHFEAVAEILAYVYSLDSKQNF
jgi:flagellar biosynthesis protein FlhB